MWKEKFFDFLSILVKALINDKILVILSATAIGIVALVKATVSPEAKEIVIPIVTGLMGVAVGMGVRRTTDNQPNGIVKP